MSDAHRKSRKSGSGRAWLVLLLTFSLVAAACGSDDGSDESGGKAPAEVAFDPAGVLRFGVGLALVSGNHFDPTQAAATSDLPWMQLVHGTLLRRSGGGKFEPMMAKDASIVDSRTVKVTLREGVTWPDGTKYDAEAVKAGLLRTLNQSSPQRQAVMNVAFKEISEIVVDGPLELTIKLKQALAGEFIPALADGEGVIVSPKQAAEAPDAIDSKPVGAGPYAVAEFRNTQLISLRKNAKFFDADAWRLGGIDFVDIPLGSAKVNALRSGDIDFAFRLGDEDIGGVTGVPGIKVAHEFSERTYQFMNLCSGKPPFDDVKVRRAVQLAIDRDRLNELVFGGRAEPALGTWPKDHAYYDKKLEEIVKHDPEEAKELLAEAGKAAVTFDAYYPGSLPHLGRAAEAVQADLKAVGITMNIVNARDVRAEFISSQKPGAMIVPGSRTGVNKYAGLFSPGQAQALCGVSRQEIVDPLAPAAAEEPGSRRSAALFRAAELEIAENAYIIPLVFNPVNTAWATDRVGGDIRTDGWEGFPLFDTLYMKKK